MRIGKHCKAILFELFDQGPSTRADLYSSVFMVGDVPIPARYRVQLYSTLRSLVSNGLVNITIGGVIWLTDRGRDVVETY